VTLSAETPDFAAIWAVARFWSSRVNAEKFSFGIDGAHVEAMSAFVFAGLPTTKTLTRVVKIAYPGYGKMFKKFTDFRDEIFRILSVFEVLNKKLKFWDFQNSENRKKGKFLEN